MAAKPRYLSTASEELGRSQKSRTQMQPQAIVESGCDVGGQPADGCADPRHVDGADLFSLRLGPVP
jgi:hypothetical protein